MLNKLLIWIDMKTNWIFITVAFTALLSVTPAAVQAKNWTNEPLMTVQKAAEQGDADAQFKLGAMYYQGRGVPQDYSKAVHWYKKAAALGQVDAQYELGTIYDLAQIVPQDYKQAVYWYKKAAEQGDADAQSNLGIMYRQGLGVPQDYSQALRWYKKAAEQGQVNAQYNLGLMYSKGLGVPKDYSKAYAFFSALVAYGDKSSIERRDDMAKKLTPAELSKAQKLAAQYFEKYQPK